MKLPQPVLKPVTDTIWELDQDYELEHSGWFYRVKAGYRTDGESIPRCFWFLTGHPFQGLGMPAAIVHDILCEAEVFPRDETDLIFKQLLERNGVNCFRAMVRYRCLRIYSGVNWTKHTAATRTKARRFLLVTKL